MKKILTSDDGKLSITIDESTTEAEAFVKIDIYERKNDKVKQVENLFRRELNGIPMFDDSDIERIAKATIDNWDKLCIMIEDENRSTEAKEPEQQLLVNVDPVEPRNRSISRPRISEYDRAAIYKYSSNGRKLFLEGKWKKVSYGKLKEKLKIRCSESSISRIVTAIEAENN